MSHTTVVDFYELNNLREKLRTLEQHIEEDKKATAEVNEIVGRYMENAAALKAEIAHLKSPVSDEEQEIHMDRARENIANEYGREFATLAYDVCSNELTATDVLMDLVRTEASLLAITAR